jgi:hypothetical protein
MSTAMPKHFDADLQNRLSTTDEVQIETQQPGANAPTHRTTIWIVVAGNNVFVRSVRGNAGRWYQEIKANPNAALHIAGQRIAVRAIPATDEMAINRVSDEYRRKYRNSSSLPSLLGTETLPTTLRLEPM